MTVEVELSPYIVEEPEQSMMMGIPVNLQLELHKKETKMIRGALRLAAGHVVTAAGLLCIHRTALYEKMRRLGIYGFDDSATLDGPVPVNLQDELHKWEIKWIRTALGQASGNVARAARLLGIHRTALYEKMRRLGVY